MVVVCHADEGNRRGRNGSGGDVLFKYRGR